jgi:PilZ domain
MHNIRAEILGGPEERKARVLRQKAPKQANGTALTGVVIPREETRRTDMRHEDRPAADGRVFNVNFRDRIHEVSVINLSGGGAMIAASLDANIGERMDLHVGKGDVVQCVVRWKKGDRLGLEFAHETQLECSEETRTKVLRGAVSKLACDADLETTRVEPVSDDNRNAARHPLIWSGELSYRSHKWAVRLRNISETGALVQCPGKLRVGSEVVLSLGEANDVAASVSWVVGDHAGLQFAEIFDVGELSNCKPQVTPPTWLRPTYLQAHVSPDSAWGQPWNRMSLDELRTELEGFLKR